MGKGKRRGLGIPATAGPVSAPLNPFTGQVDDPTAGPASAAPDAAAPDALDVQPAGAEAAKAGGVPMYDAQGNAVDVDPGAAKGALLSGELFFSGDQKVNVKGPRGEIYSVDASTAAKALAHKDYSVASGDEVAGALKRAEQNTIGKSVEAGAVGFGRGLTLGLADPLAIGAAGLVGGQEAKAATREHLRDLKEYHPVASIGGEIAGALAPVVLSAGAGAGVEGGELAARGGAAALEAGEAAKASGGVGSAIAGGIRTIGTLPRAVAGAGELAEHGAAHLVGHGATSLIGQVAQKAIPMAAQGAVEGGLYGMGAEVSESALGDHELNAEKLLAAAKHGAVFGAMTGGVIGAGEVLGKAAVKQGLKLMGKESVEDFFRSFSQERTVKALGGDAAAMRRLGEDKARDVADTVMEYRFNDGQKLFKAGATVDELGERVGKALEEQNSRLSGIRDKVAGITGESAELAPDVKGLLGKVDQDVLAPLHASDVASVRAKADKVEREIASLRERSLSPEERLANFNLPPDHPLSGIIEEAKGGNPGAQQALETVRQKNLASPHPDPDLEGAFAGKPVTIEELTQFRKDLDSVVFPKVKVGVPPPAPEHAAELLQVRRMVEDEIEAATERAAKASGNPQLYADFLDAKQKIHRLIPAQQMAEKASINQVGHRFFSLSDTLYSAGAGSGLLAGGGLASLGAVPAGLATAAVHKLVRERSSSFLAAAADRMANFAAIQRATSAVDEQIAVGVKDFLTHSGREALHLATEAHAAEAGQEELERSVVPSAVHFLTGKAGQSKAEALRERHEHAAELATNPAVHAARVQGLVQDVAVHAPTTATAMAQKATQTADNLKKQLPDMAPQAGSLTPQLDKPRLSPSDMAKFARYAAAADNPMTLVHEMKAGIVARDTVRAVKENYPKLFEQIQNQVLQNLHTAKTPPPYETRKQLGILLGIPADKSQSPAFLQTIAAMYQATSTQAGQGGGAKAGPSVPRSGPKRPVHIASSHMSASVDLASTE